MGINKEKFIQLKLEPALRNVERSLERFSSIEINSSAFERIKKDVDSIRQYDHDEESMATPDDEALQEKLMQSTADLAALASVVSGETPNGGTELGLKKFGEQFGQKFQLYANTDDKLMAGVCSGLADKLATRFTLVSKKNWMYLLRIIFLVPYFWAFYLLAYWVMINAPASVKEEKPLETSDLSTTLCLEVARAIESALSQDGQLQSIISDLQSTMERIADAFSAEELRGAQKVADFISGWDHADQHVPDVIYVSVAEMTEKQKKYAHTDDVTALEFARSELRLIENTIGYASLVAAADATDEGEHMQISYNNNVELSVAEYAGEFRAALEAGDYHLAAYYLGRDSVSTENERINENNQRIAIEQQEAEDQRARKETAAASQSNSSGADEEGFLDNRRNLMGKQCKNLACGHMNGHLDYKCKKCGNFLGL